MALNITLADDDIRAQYPAYGIDCRMMRDIWLVPSSGACAPVPHWRFNCEEQNKTVEEKFVMFKKDYLQHLYLTRVFKSLRGEPKP